MSLIPDGHPSIEAVHVPGEGLLHPVDPDVAPATPVVAAVEDGPTEVEPGTKRRTRTAPADTSADKPEEA